MLLIYFCLWFLNIKIAAISSLSEVEGESNSWWREKVLRKEKMCPSRVGIILIWVLKNLLFQRSSIFRKCLSQSLARQETNLKNYWTARISSSSPSVAPSSSPWHGVSSFPLPPWQRVSDRSQRKGPWAGCRRRLPARSQRKWNEDERSWGFRIQTLKRTTCTSVHTDLRAVPLAAEVWACRPEGLRGGAAVDLRAGRSVGYGRTIII